VAGRRPRDLDTGVDDQSASSRLIVSSTSSRAQGPERAVKAGDRSKSNKVLPAAKGHKDRPVPRVEDSDSSGCDSDSSASDSDSSASPISPPDPYDGKPDQRVFDVWVYKVEHWASLAELSRKEVMCWFPRLVTGEAEQCFQEHVLPTLYSRKWEFKEVFEILQEHCFPFDHKVKLYEQLKSVKQGNRKVIVYAGEVRFYAKHLPYVSEEFLALVFWAGLNRHTQSKLIMHGVKPNRAGLKTLIRRALKHSDGTSLPEDW
jgi:hypothetical protein